MTSLLPKEIENTILMEVTFSSPPEMAALFEQRMHKSGNHQF
jgi:hypothetical protein